MGSRKFTYWEKLEVSACDTVLIVEMEELMSFRGINLVVLVALSVMGVGTLLIPSLPEVIHFLLACTLVAQALIACLLLKGESKK